MIGLIEEEFELKKEIDSRYNYLDHLIGELENYELEINKLERMLFEKNQRIEDLSIKVNDNCRIIELVESMLNNN